MDDAALHTKIIVWARQASLEIAFPHRLDDALVARLRGRSLFIPSFPNGKDPVQTVIAQAVVLKQRGLDPVPHIAVRNYRDVAHLEMALQALHHVSITRVLLIAGDNTRSGAITDTLDLLQKPNLGELFKRYGITSLCFAAHPEGHRHARDADHALTVKKSFIRSSKIDGAFITQFGFNSPAMLQWVGKHGDINVKAGIYGSLPSPFALYNYARKCGLPVTQIIGNLPRMIGVYLTGLVRNRTPIPDQLIVDYADNVSGTLTGLHFFALGDAATTPAMFEALGQGKFTIATTKTGQKRLYIDGFARHKKAG